jgi:hypothetical protein
MTCTKARQPPRSTPTWRSHTLGNAKSARGVGGDHQSQAESLYSLGGPDRERRDPPAKIDVVTASPAMTTWPARFDGLTLVDLLDASVPALYCRDDDRLEILVGQHPRCPQRRGAPVQLG